MSICPSCGSTVKADLCIGCPACGARAVGPPLARAEHELPSFGRASFLFASGCTVLCTFLGLSIAVLVENRTRPDFWSIVSAGEVAAWRVKWAALPVLIALLIAGVKITRSIKLNPSRYIGLRAARIGFLSAIAVSVLIATLIGVTIPVRLERRQWGLQAAVNAHGHTLQRAMMEYRELHGTYPTDPDKLIEALRTLPDPDGSITEALRFVDANGYQPSTVLAAAATKGKALVPRGAALRNATANLNPEPPTVSFTNYDLRLPGPDKIMNTDDDLIVHDGLVMTVSEFRDYKASHLTTP